MRFAARLLLAALLSLAFLSAARAATYSVVGSDGTPSVGTCGTSPSVSGTDHAGVITLGSGVVTACTLTFSATMPAAPICIVSSGSTSSAASVTSVSTSALVAGLTVTLPSGKLYYICVVR